MASDMHLDLGNCIRPNLRVEIEVIMAAFTLKN